MFLMPLLFLLGVVAIVWVLLDRGRERPPDVAPLEVARRRYAAGEIDTAEFDRISRGVGRSTGGRGASPAPALAIGLSLGALFLVISLVMFAWMAWAGAWGNWGFGPMDHMRGWERPIPAATPPPLDDDQVLVRIANFEFDPDAITIVAGTTVVWLNEDSASHTVSANDHSWDTGLLARGETGLIRFDQPGTYAYHCDPHPWMEAIIHVIEPD